MWVYINIVIILNMLGSMFIRILIYIKCVEYIIIFNILRLLNYLFGVINIY